VAILHHPEYEEFMTRIVCRSYNEIRIDQVTVRQGEPGNCMFVIQSGNVEAIAETDGREMRLRTLGTNDFFGEMALFEEETRTATIRAVGPARVLTIDKKNFLGGIHEDPSLAFRIVQTMSHRIRDLTDRLAKYEEEV
jgi:CRP-like cAMP-binding protein